MKEYSFLNTLLLVNGVEISGFDEGDDVITLERLNDSGLDKVGVDGEMTLSVSADRRGTITFRLMQSSSSNAVLGALVTAMENGAFVPAFIQFKDTKGNDLGSGTQGFVVKPASMVRGESANAQEWMLRVERLDLIYTSG